MPLSGTYEFRPTLIISKSDISGHPWTVSPGGATDDPALLAAVQTNNSSQIFVGGAGAYSDAFIIFSCSWFLDGSATPLGVNDLPPGFVMTSCSLQFTQGSGALDIANNPISCEFSPTESFNLPGNGSAVILDFPHPGGPPSPVHLNTDLLAFRITDAGLIGNLNAGCSQLIGIGAYTAFPYTYTLNPPTAANVDAGNDNQGGKLITITSDPDDPDHLLLNHLTISVTCGAITIVDQTETLFSFYLPIACNGNGDTSITATGDGTQFSGSVALGTMDILLTNASGIYNLVAGKTNDTLYSSLRDGTTRDVKIPNPFIKTGYIGG